MIQAEAQLVAEVSLLFGTVVLTLQLELGLLEPVAVAEKAQETLAVLHLQAVLEEHP
jgi:hypothetical protein